MHVLSIVHSATFGGPHNQALQLPPRAGTYRVGLRLTVVLPTSRGRRRPAPGRRLAVIQLPLLRSWASRRPAGPDRTLMARYPGQIMRLRRLIEEEAVDVVEVHGLLNVDGAAGRSTGRAGGDLAAHRAPGRHAR